MTSAVVQLAIGMVLVFFLVGSACSFLNELVAAALNRRAVHLQRWLVKLLGSDDKDRFFEHPLIRELRGARLDLLRDKRNSSQGPAPAEDTPTGLRGLRYSKVPSYMSAATFSTTLLSLLGKSEERETVPRTAEELRTAIGRLRDPTFQGVLRTLFHDAGEDVAQFRRRLEQWFDEEMDRLSGWYKRRTKWFLLLWGLGLAIVLNVDVALLVRTLWTDSTLRSAVVAEAQRLEAPATTTPGASSGSTTTNPCPIPASGTPGESATSTTAPDPLDCLAARIDSLQALSAADRLARLAVPGGRLPRYRQAHPAPSRRLGTKDLGADHHCPRCHARGPVLVRPARKAHQPAVDRAAAGQTGTGR